MALFGIILDLRQLYSVESDSFCNDNVVDPHLDMIHQCQNLFLHLSG